jgi:hypothetical protein
MSSHYDAPTLFPAGTRRVLDHKEIEWGYGNPTQWNDVCPSYEYILSEDTGIVEWAQSLWYHDGQNEEGKAVWRYKKS